MKAEKGAQPPLGDLTDGGVRPDRLRTTKITKITKVFFAPFVVIDPVLIVGA